MDIGSGGSAAAGGQGSADLIKDSSTTGFAQDVIEASKSALVLVDFWASWCGPCRTLGPILEKVVKAYGGKVRLVKIDTDEHQAIAGQMRIQSLPTVYAFKDGRPLDGFMGALPESQVRAFVDRLLGEDAGDQLQAAMAGAEDAIAEGDLQGAAEIYAAILQEDQLNPAALAGLANCYLKSGDLDRAEQTIALVPPDKRNTAAVEAVRAALDLARKAGDAGDASELEAKLAANPADPQTRFDLAIALASKGFKAEAVDHLVEIVRRQRTWNEEGARKQLVQFFEAWGPKDPATLEGRRKLSSVLFS
ncbi:MAG TPA: thioredoxin [Hyphomicrobiaceae bacterium]|nr:thioredoxin [Hyphomicrobiaceae bacterium]